MIECAVATARESKVIRKMESQIFPDAWSEKSLADFFARPDAVAFLCFFNEKPCGYLIGTANGAEGEIFRIATLPTARRRGVARRLLDAYCQTMAQGSAVFLEVRASNTPARLLYESAGFSVIGERKNYYVRPTENAVIYRHIIHKEELS